MVAEAPLVSILIRSMDRPTLQRALDSAAAQTWRNLEIVVVAACGNSHRALPDEYRGRPLRLVLPPSGSRLPRAEAANLALESARGEWLNFLDDDDELLPQHLATLLTAPRGAGERVVYSRTRVADASGKVLGHVSHAGNHAQLYFHSRTTTCAALLHRSLVDEGARFDPAFAVHEDHDFQVNCATRTAFRFVDAPTCVWHADAGESGCGFGANDNPAQRSASVRAIREKWNAAFAGWLSDFDDVLYTGEQYLTGGDLNAARACIAQALRLRPDDVRAHQLATRAGIKFQRQPIESSTREMPLVSILIRSMDRPSLRRALDSAAAQTWPNIEIVVASACGSAHGALPEQWNGRPLRLVHSALDRNLSRPEAANLCLDHARGAWLNFLDDDDELLPEHVTTLLGAASKSKARVFFSRARVYDEHGQHTRDIGFDSHPVQLYDLNCTTTCGTLFHRSLVDEGARFDAAFPVFEDHDFFINCATRSEFVFVDAATCIWNAHSGESGCGYGANNETDLRKTYLVKLREKWVDFFTPLRKQLESLLLPGQQFLRENQPTKALAHLEAAVSAYPYDVNALNLCGMANLRLGKFDRAESLFIRALQLLPLHQGIISNLELLRRTRAERAQRR